MIDLKTISSRYEVRELTGADADDILELCLENPQFYRYTAARPDREQIVNDLIKIPPGTGPEDKHFIGFYSKGELVAVMDLIDGYPNPQTAYIGFFMMNAAYQGRGIGSDIILEAADALERAGKRSIRLAIDQGNPQSLHFWKKNGFYAIAEKDVNGWGKLVAERPLSR